MVPLYNNYSRIHLVSIVGIHWVYPLFIFSMTLAVHRFCSYAIFAKLFFTDLRPFQNSGNFSEKTLSVIRVWVIRYFGSSQSFQTVC